MPLILLSAGRTIFGALAYWALFLAFVGPEEITTIPLWAAGYLALAVVGGLLFGDLLYLKAQDLIGVSRALPIAGSYPLLTAVLALFVLHEDLTAQTLVGIIVTLCGVYLVARPQRGRPLDASSQKSNGLGLAAAFGASLFWSVSTISLKPAVEVVEPVVANAIRLPMAAVLLVGLASSRPSGLAIWRFGLPTVLLVVAAGALHALSSGFYLVAVQIAGAAKAATLTSTAPLFAAPLAIVFAHERPGRMVLVGTLLSVVGIYLVV